jgi:hypothetical protein
VFAGTAAYGGEEDISIVFNVFVRRFTVIYCCAAVLRGNWA